MKFWISNSCSKNVVLCDILPRSSGEIHQPINIDEFGETMKTTVQTLKSRIETLETELIAMRRMLGATMEKKDSEARR
jgi:chaperonin cofactor prefoldin